MALTILYLLCTYIKLDFLFRLFLPLYIYIYIYIHIMVFIFSIAFSKPARQNGPNVFIFMRCNC